MEENKPQSPGKGPQKVIETYVGDMVDVIEGSTGGQVKKIIHGEEAREVEKKEQSPESKKNKLFMALGTLLAMVSLGLLFFLLFSNTVKTVEVEKPYIPIILTDRNTLLEVKSLTKNEITDKIYKAEINSSVKPGEVEAIFPVENQNLIGLRHFLALIEAHFSPGGANTFIGDNFLLGVVKIDPSTDFSVLRPGNGFFFIMRMRAMPDIFNSLRAWEEFMLSDLHSFAGINITRDTNYLFSKNFEDGIVENKNARILYDNEGSAILMYVFANDNTVIITNNLKAAHEVMLRLSAGKIEQGS
jgi:hypothetical protein